MLCWPEEEFAQGPEPENPAFTTKRALNDGSSHDDPDAKESSLSETQSDDDEKKERTSHVLKYEVVKRWPAAGWLKKGQRKMMTTFKTIFKLNLKGLMRILIELSRQRTFLGDSQRF
jgi:hypothetical protein